MRVVLASLLFAAACSGGLPAPTSAPNSTLYGVAGLIVPRTQTTVAAAYEALYSSFTTTGGAVGVYTNWSDRGDLDGKVPVAIPATIAAAAKYRFGPLVIALGVARDAQNGPQSSVDWASPQRDRFLEAVTAVARDHRPDYLALGVETNRLFVTDRAAFDGFVGAYPEAYDAVKKVSPSTKVFTIFQLELMKGHAMRWTGRDDPPQWDLLKRFAGRLDLVGFTTYPFLQYARPADIPDDYYTDAATRAEAPVAYTEIGWPSAGVASAPFGYEASTATQAAFVERFFALTARARPRLALWSFPYELGRLGDLFDSVALRTGDGIAKPALASWQKGIATK
jgi:hypothetical protein